ncbi:uncharacterized protein LOC106877000 [Octopus bimaculoides]|uniref:Lipocalin/cytosolic fatty-acid binding domain-containing protein n=1 Tax=Octopus bimaculoides TaxID=37653 RepID=A0A0L8GHN7_OCTBM|nr:uncharacterized protein LOC106877000 [Octopus bimaculoides]|eukprot:XP_014781266.1 PREDICTED: uncharacterized protein LOC106877000 [Octopus bimaculoides]
MESFVGKWEQIDDEIPNHDAFLNTAGISEDRKKKMKTKSVIEYQPSGSQWKHVATDKKSKASQSYLFELGVPAVAEDLYGHKFKVVTNIEDRNKMKEVYTEWCDFDVNVVREISGNVMHITLTVKDVSCKVTFKKIV